MCDTHAILLWYTNAGSLSACIKGLQRLAIDGLLGMQDELSMVDLASLCGRMRLFIACFFSQFECQRSHECAGISGERRDDEGTFTRLLIPI